MSDALTLREQLEASLALDTRETEGRLRALIAQHDRLKGALRDVSDQLAAESRRYADMQRLTVRPSIEQLRQQLVKKARPK